MRGDEADGDRAALEQHRDRARVGRDLRDLEPDAGPDAALPQEPQELAIRLRLLGDAVDDEGLSGLRLAQRQRSNVISANAVP